MYLFTLTYSYYNRNMLLPVMCEIYYEIFQEDNVPAYWARATVNVMKRWTRSFHGLRTQIWTQ